ncbi:nucleotide-binding domain-containing protein [Nostoc sp.]|uniref:nucleotide-binding domain-containing protein n=1 Tax=Nostoc sp. TaxID=1180 RepID=UPI002FF61CD1
MANCHKLFLKFNTLIALKSKQKERLRVSRNAIRDRIRRYFQNKQNGFFPKFHGQGSLIMNTIIEPLDREFDIDDGIYFKVEAKPIQSVSTLHQWIWEAINGHTKQNPIDKQTCVRLVYAGQYHLDLPIYYIIEGQTPYLAHKSKGWIKSDPREFIKWFNEKADNDGQLKRIVRYLKAWSDYRKGDLPSGLIFSILAANNIVFDERDDIALYKTLLNIKSSLKRSFVCYRPTIPADENLLEDYSKTNKDYFLEQLGSFIQSAEKALDEKTSQKDACKAWQRHFGEDRFPFESYANTEEFIENRFTIDIRYELKIDCLVSQQGFRTHSLIEMILSRLPLLRGKSLKFYIVDCNVPKPFQVKWKVRNVGEEATRRDQIRGQILNDSGNHQKNESSLFHGAHFVECYIIKDNICVARSRIDVPIKFPE